MRRILISSIILFLASSMQMLWANTNEEVDQLNTEAYAKRYSDISYSLQCAKKAYSLSADYPDGRAEALNNLSYISYQQMHFDQVKHFVNDVYHLSRNQIELLCADVISMKVDQRIGEGNDFFNCRNRAQRRIQRISDDLQFLNKRQLKRFFYACSEMHIISSTYYYYLGQDSASIAEIKLASDDIELERDTTQWLYYHYMLGSGGLIEGNEVDVRLDEFDHLFKAYTLARANGILYFEANTLQSIASMFADQKYALLIKSVRPDAYNYLKNEHAYWTPEVLTDSIYQLPLALAEHALYLFKHYHDLFQTACVYRTIGEILFKAQDYDKALRAYQQALNLVTAQRKRSSQTVSPWMATIHERLSMAYSALNDKHMSDYHRNIYLDLLDNSRQNKELDSRKEILGIEITVIRIKLLFLFVLFAIVVALAVAYMYKLRRRTSSHLSQALNVFDSEDYVAANQAANDLLTELEDDKDELNDGYQVNCQKIENYKQDNVERRAKVSLVYAIIPYLDRMLAEAKKMTDSGVSNQDSLQYINELSVEIIHLNDILTDWIKMQKGQVQLHVSTFPLQKLFDIVALNKHTFAEKGLTLNVASCSTQVKADESLTLFMINTLADNARKFTKQGGSVSIKVEETEKYAEISIVDTGVGLSSEDVETLNNSKVYDSSHLGLGQDNKGFGFGIMNCKGIINNYKKIASIFEVCDFGVESQVGQGSRFWFRLPRMLTMLVMLLGFNFVSARNQQSYDLYNAVYNANVEGRYADAYFYGDSALRVMQAPADTALLISLHNEMAIAALALQQWDEYKMHNQACVHLHQLYSQDPSLASDCLRMEKMKSDTTMMYVILVILSFVALLLFYLLFLRGKVNTGRSYRNLMAIFHNTLQRLRQHVAMVRTTRCDDQDDTLSLNASFLSDLSALHADALAVAKNHSSLQQLVNEFYQKITDLVHSIETAENEISVESERFNKSKFEADRLYVMNQILDNSLSTIKHETMYYPSRAQVMVSDMLSGQASSTDLNDLYQLLSYYREVYLLLYEQASRQLAVNDFRRTTVSVAELSAIIRSKVENFNRRNSSSIAFEGCDVDAQFVADRSLLDVFIRQMLSVTLPGTKSLQVTSQQEEHIVLLTFVFHGNVKSDEEVQELFSPAIDRIPYLIMKQIIREHDAKLSHPGLRLYAESLADGYSINMTMITTKK